MTSYVRKPRTEVAIVLLSGCSRFAALDDQSAASGGSGGAPTLISPETMRQPSRPGNLDVAPVGVPRPLPMEGNPTSVNPIDGEPSGVTPPAFIPIDAGQQPPESEQGAVDDASPAGDPPAEPARPPVSVRFVALVADSAIQGGRVACIADFNLLGPDQQLLDRSLWRAYADSEEPNYLGGAPASAAIDDDPLSLWHTAWFGLEVTPGFPHYLLIDLGALEQISGLLYLPRQDQAIGRISSYRVFASVDSDLGQPVASGTFPDTTAEQTVLFSAD